MKGTEYLHWLREFGMLEGKGYRSLDEVLLFIAAFIDQSTEFEKAEPVTRVHTRYSEIVADVMEDTQQPAWSAEYQITLKKLRNSGRCRYRCLTSSVTLFFTL